MSDLHQYQQQFTARIRDPKRQDAPLDIDIARMRVYEEIVFNNLESSVSACFPVCRTILGQSDWLSLVRGFLAQHVSTSPIFRDIPKAFLDYLQVTDAQPGFLQSLAHYEWMELAIAAADVADDMQSTDQDGDLLSGVPVLAASLAVVEYDYPVHQISPESLPEAALDHPVSLMIFRKLDDTVAFIELNAMTARLIQKLQDQKLTGKTLLLSLLPDIPAMDEATLLIFGQKILEDLRVQGAILGTKIEEAQY